LLYLFAFDLQRGVDFYYIKTLGCGSRKGKEKYQM